MIAPTLTRAARLRRPALLATLVFAACLAMVSLGDYLRLQHEQRTAAELANILADQLASGASQAMLTGDRLALQVLVTDLARHPDIAAASVYDAGDKLLALSGDKPTERAFTVRADIELDDSVAGYASITLLHFPGWNGLGDPALVLAAAGFAALVFLAALVPPAALRSLNAPEEAAGLAASPRAQPVDTSPGAEVQVLLAPGISPPHPLLDDLDRAAGQVCHLYDGQGELLANGLKAHFTRGTDRNFRAFCAAWLWRGLLVRHGAAYPGVETTVFIRGIDEDSADPPPAEGNAVYLTRVALAQGDLANRISITQADDDWYRVKSVSEDYEQLLQRQLTRILQAGGAATPS